MVAVSKSTWPTPAPAVEEAEVEEDTGEAEGGTRAVEAEEDMVAEGDTTADTNQVEFSCCFHCMKYLINPLIFLGAVIRAVEAGYDMEWGR